MEDIFTKSLAEGTNRETEISINISRDVFERVAKSWAGTRPYTIETTANFISSTGRAADESPKKIRRILFVNGKSAGSDYSTKVKLYATKFECAGQVGRLRVSDEKPVDQFATDDNAVVRLKVRISSVYDRWRVDLTIVKQAPFAAIKSRLPAICQEMFNNTNTIEGILSKQIAGTKYEAEIEYMSSADPSPHLRDLEPLCEMLATEQRDDGGEDTAAVIEIARVIGTYGKTIKQVGNQVTALTKPIYMEMFPPVGWFVTVKYDGLRAFVMIKGTNGKLLTSGRAAIEFETKEPHRLTILDGEYQPEEKTFYAFDCIATNGDNVTGEPYPLRYGHIRAIDTTGVMIKPKPVTQLTQDFAAEISSLWPAERPSDGLIFTSAVGSYSDTKNIKWKPVEHLSIDFLAIECKPPLLGMKPYLGRDGETLYILFNGITERMRQNFGMSFIPHYAELVGHPPADYFPIQFSPSIDPRAHIWYGPPGLTGQIVELTRRDNAWHLLKIREDRKRESGYYGNDFRIAELTFMLFIDEFSFEDLLTGATGDDYFGIADTSYKAANAYKRIIISAMVEKYFSKSARIVDTMAGRGADMFRYAKVGVKNVLLIDIDKPAVVEAIRRKLTARQDLARQSPASKVHKGQLHKGQPDRRQNYSMQNTESGVNFSAAIADMKTTHVDLVALAEKYGYTENNVDGVVCNFAIHYMCDTMANIVNYLRFVARMIMPGGHFLFTCMSGERIAALLEDLPPGESYEWRHEETVKYKIVKLYKGKRAGWGSTIAVKLPFSQELREEPLAPIEQIITIAKKMGFEPVQNDPMSLFQIQSGDALADIDREFIALHQVVVLRMSRKPTSLATKTITGGRTIGKFAR